MASLIRFSYYKLLIALLWSSSAVFAQDSLPSIEDIGTSYPTRTPISLPVDLELTLKRDTIFRSVAYFRPLSLSLVAISATDTFKKEVLSSTKLAQKFPSTNYSYSIASKSSIQRKVDLAAPVKLHKKRVNWIIYVLLIITSFFVFVRYQYAKDVKNINDGFWTLRGLNLLIRENGLLNTRYSLMFYLMFCLTFGYLIYCICTFYELVFFYSDLSLYLVICFFVALFFVARTCSILLLGFIFSNTKIFKSYIAIIYTSNYVFTIYLIPILIIYTLLPDSLKDVLFIILPLLVVINQLNQYLRGSSYAVAHFQFPKFYLIIYLCAFEIAPLLLLIKSFSG